MKINRGFKRALITSIILHGLILILLISSPSLPRPERKGMIYYLPLNLVGQPGGGGGGSGGGPPGAKTLASDRPSIRDLAAVQKKAPEVSSSSLRYPVDKKTASKKATEKKTVISKPQSESEARGQQIGGVGTGVGTGASGSGLRIGVGSGPGGPGTGGWGSGNFDLSAFPFTYYLQIIQDKISTNWFTSLIDPGASGVFQCIIFFKILRDGRIIDLQIEISSGSRSFDLSALRAVQNASPFPPLPREFEGEYLGVHLIFEHLK